MSEASARVVQRQLDAYNSQDLDAYCDCFSSDCVIADLNGAVTSDGLAAIRARYGALFSEFPQNRARLVNRISVGEVVIDHEDVVRAPGNSFRCAAIYTVRDGGIVRVDFVREP